MKVTDSSCAGCEKDRAALERLLAAVLAVSDVGITVFDERGRFVMSNPSFLSLFHWRTSSLRTETFASLFPDAKLPRSMIRLPRSVHAGRYQARIRGGDSSFIAVEVHARWITHEDEESYWVAALTPVVTIGDPAKPTSPSVEGSAAASGAVGFGQAVFQRIRKSLLGPHVMAGHIEVMNLDPIKRAAGERWPQVATHIFSEAEAIVARNLTANDAFMHDGSGGFTVCFGDAALDEAERRAASIEQDIRDRLTGQLGVSAAPDARSSVDHIILRQEEQATRDLGSLIASKLAERRALIERASSATLTQVIAAATLDPHVVISRTGLPTSLVAAKLDRTTLRAVQKIAAISRMPDDIANQIDHLLLGLAATNGYERLSKANPPTYIVPVSFKTFTSRRLESRYLDLCRGLSAGVTKHLIFELTDVPDDVANMRIEDIVASLRAYSPLQCLRLTGLERVTGKSWERHFTFLTVLHQDIEPGRRGPDALRAAVDMLNRRRCRLCVRGVPDQTTARTLAEAGVHLVSGPYLIPWNNESRE